MTHLINVLFSAPVLHGEIQKVGRGLYQVLVTKELLLGSLSLELTPGRMGFELCVARKYCRWWVEGRVGMEVLGLFSGGGGVRCVRLGY